MTKRVYKEFDESIEEFQHHSGLKVQLIPKKGFHKKFAIFSVDFGSVNTRFILPGENKITVVPKGVAHFLEHKLFEQPDMNVMDLYADLGASCNAATSFSRTYYYFTCTDKFDKCFKLLMNYVLHPNITEESVEKEKGIIIQEINMYLDSPEYIASMNLFKLLYFCNPVRDDIAGTAEDVNATTADILKLCHKTFYTPSNMVLTVVGDLSIDEIEAMVNQCVGSYESPCVERIFLPEPEKIAGSNNSVNMNVAMPIFNIGFKDIPERFEGIGRARREMAGNVLKEMLFGKTSDYYNEIYNKGLINQEFNIDYDIERQYAIATLEGETPNADELISSITAYLQRCKRDGLSKYDFEMIRNAQQGALMRRFNSPEALGRIFSSLYLQGVDGFDYFKACGTITFEDVMNVFEEVFLSDMAVSLVLPADVS